MRSAEALSKLCMSLGLPNLVESREEGDEVRYRFAAGHEVFVVPSEQPLFAALEGWGGG